MKRHSKVQISLFFKKAKFKPLKLPKNVINEYKKGHNEVIDGQYLDFLYFAFFFLEAYKETLPETFKSIFFN